MKRRICCLLLAVLMALSMGITAFAANEEDGLFSSRAVNGQTYLDSYEQFLAYYYLEYSPLDYYLENDELPYHHYLHNSNDKMDETIAAWKLTTFGSEGLSYHADEVDFYVLLLYDIIYQKVHRESELDVFAASNDALMTSALAELGEAAAEGALELMPDLHITDDNWEEVFDAISKTEAVKITANVLGGTVQFLKGADKVEDLFERLNAVKEFVDCTDTMKTILADIYNYTDDPILREAVGEIEFVISNLYSEETIALLTQGERTVAEVGEFVLDAAWAALSKVNVYTKIFTLVQQGSKLAVNAFVGTDQIAENWCSMEKVYTFETVLKERLLVYKTRFEKNPTYENAVVFNKAADMYLNTLSVGMEYAAKYAESVRGGGLVGLVYKLYSFVFNDTEHKDMINSLESIQKCIDDAIKFAHNNTYNFYLDELEVGYPALVVEIGPTKTTTEVTEETLIADEEIVEECMYLLTNQTTTTSVTFEEERMTYADYYHKGGTLNLAGETLTVYGDFYLSGGTVNLMGGTLDIRGNLYHTNGNIYFNKGTLKIGGDYRMHNTAVNSAGEESLTSIYGNLYMDYAEDLLQVGGDFIVFGHGKSSTNYNGECVMSAGRIELLGDFQQIAGPYLNFKSTGTHTVAFVGAGPHNVSVASSDAKIAHLEMDEEAEVTWKGYLNIGILENDGEIIGDDVTISGLHLNGHTLKIEGDVRITGDVNGCQGILEITGDVRHTNGSVALNKSTLKIGGDYRMHNTAVNSAGEEYLTSIYGNLYMDYAEDLLQIGGDFVVFGHGKQSIHYNGECVMSAGRIELSGDFQQIAGPYLNFKSTGTHKIALVGAGPHNVSVANSDARIAHLEIDEDAEMTWKGYLNIGILENDGEIIGDDVTISGLHLNGHTLKIEGDVRITGDVNGCQGILEITGDVRHTNGSVALNKSTLKIGGDYRMHNTAVNGAGEEYLSYSYGNLFMDYAEDLLQAGGDFIVFGKGRRYSSDNGGCAMLAGRIELSGDFHQYAGQDDNFVSSGTHTIALVGAGPHNVSVASSNAAMAHLEMDEDAEITWKSYLNVGTLESDGEISSEGAIISGLHLNGHTLKIEGDVQVVGAINGSRGMLEITGDVRHTNGSVVLNKSTLKIGGDYRMHGTAVNGAGEEYLSYSYGNLFMDYAEDLLQAGGDFIVFGKGRRYSSDNGGCAMLAGRIELSGDFRQYAGQDDNFVASGTHVTVLNGTGDPQYITFADSRFNILQMTRSGEWYVFSPDNCWNSLWTEPDTTIPVTNISLSDRSRKLQVGEVYTIAALVTPANATDPTLTWTSSDPTVASVTQDGTVTALAEGTAVIRAQAGNVYRTCTVTVSEVYTGEIEIGSVIAGPGETVHIPVMVWDNPGFAAMKIHIGYDPALLTLLDVAAGEALDVGTLDFEPVEDGCNILWYNGQDAAENGVLFHLAMQVAENAAVDRPIALTPTIEKGDVCKENHQAVLFTLTSGAVQVSSIEKGDIYEDGALNVHDILLLQHYLTDLETLSDRQLYAADLNGDGSVNMKDIVLLAQQLLQRVTLLDDGGLQPMTFALGEGAFDEEGYVEIPLLVSGETPLAAMRMEILYDHALAELVEIEAAELLEENFCHNLSDAARTRDLVTWYKASDVEMEGSIMTLRFRLLDDRYDGLIPVVLRTAEGDICNARLESPEVENLHGVLRTEGYDLHAWVSSLDAAVNEDGSAELTGTLVCTQDMQGAEAMVTFAAYTADGRMTNIWTETIELQNGERLCAEGDLYGGTEVQVFLTTADSYMPLSCTSVCAAE